MFDNSKTFTPNQGSAVLMSANALFCIPAMYSMGLFGRRTLILITQIGMGVTLYTIWFCEDQEYDTMAIYACTLYLFLFEFGIGSIFYAYLAEACTSKVMSIAAGQLFFW